MGEDESWRSTKRGIGREEGRRVDEKRRGWLPNSNLGVGWVGKWAQCGVTLRAFALSPSLLTPATPPPSLPPLSTPPRFFIPHSVLHFTLLLTRFNLLLLHSRAQAPRPLSSPLSLTRHLGNPPLPRHPLSQIDRP